MALPSSSVTITAGAGTVIAAETVDGKQYQVVMVARANGELEGTVETQYVWSGHAVGAQNRDHLEIFNAAGSGKIVKVRKVFLQCSLAAITGVGHTFELIKTSAVGTGGTAITFRPADSDNAAVPAQITGRAGPTGGATASFTYFIIPANPEETLPAGAIMPMINWLAEGPAIQDITLREGQGLKVRQITNNTAATWGVLFVVTIADS